ncbi:MAG: DUF3105 domain-containing protein [Frankiales bacterium]|nr:MAG: DUF3105 domain-containing protein [Frankiales bacterium]
MARTPATPRRAAPTKVSKPFPWGTVVGSVVLGAALVGLIVYAAANQGSGVRDLVRNPDAAIEGVAVAEGELERDHVAGPVDYDQTPPNSGPHNATPQQCDVYTEPIAPEHAIHSLEHGAVWITYNEDLPADQVEKLAAKVEGDPYGLMSPVPEQASPINLSAWGRRLSVDNADDSRIDDFIEGYRSGPQTPERGAACIGTTATGPVAAAGEQPSSEVEVPVAPASPAG